MKPLLLLVLRVLFAIDVTEFAPSNDVAMLTQRLDRRSNLHSKNLRRLIFMRELSDRT